MDRDLLRQLSEAGAIADADGETPAVKVSLQYQHRLTGRRHERFEQLQQQFARVAERLAERGAQLDLSSMSVLGQTVEATLPVTAYEEIVEELGQSDMRVDPIVARNATAAE